MYVHDEIFVLVMQRLLCAHIISNNGINEFLARYL